MAEGPATGAPALNVNWLHRAAGCYLRAGLPHEAARCYRDAGAHELAAQAWESIHAYAEAAEDYVAAGLPELAGWLLAHELGDAEAARAVLAAAPPDVPAREPGRPFSGGERALRHRLAAARCDVLEGESGAESWDGLAALDDVQTHLAADSPLFDHLLEPWAVALTEALDRPDLTACVFAAAVRGRRRGAAERWDAWSRRRLRVPLVLPAEYGRSGAGEPAGAAARGRLGGWIGPDPGDAG
jgi:hypothetical protein